MAQTTPLTAGRAAKRIEPEVNHRRRKQRQ